MGYGVEEVTRRAGVTREFVGLLGEFGLLPPKPNGFDDLDARRIACYEAMHRADVPLEVLARGVGDGTISFAFLEHPVYERFAATSDETFASVAEGTGLPLALLSVVREAAGAPPPDPADYMREYELQVAPYLATGIRAGLTPKSLERMLRVQGESLRRIAETESDSWFSDILTPALARGGDQAYAIPEDTMQLADLMDDAVVAMLHAQQGQRWLGNVVRGLGAQLSVAGLHAQPERLPAIVFLDVTGYTRLTQERGDAAAAELATDLGRVVQRTSASYGGKPIKWLGDGVMLYFENTSSAVDGALAMVAALGDAGMPPAHVGVHCGEVLFQQGDYFGQTVNVASRIADFARPGEVLVSADAVRAMGEGSSTHFVDIGEVELKGVSGPMRLFAANARPVPSAAGSAAG